MNFLRRKMGCQGISIFFRYILNRLDYFWFQIIHMATSYVRVNKKLYFLTYKASQVALLSHFSCVRLLATPWTTAYQAPPFMGFSRQEYWSGVPLPSPIIKMTTVLMKTASKFTWRDIMLIV